MTIAAAGKLLELSLQQRNSDRTLAAAEFIIMWPCLSNLALFRKEFKLIKNLKNLDAMALRVKRQLPMLAKPEDLLPTQTMHGAEFIFEVIKLPNI